MTEQNEFYLRESLRKLTELWTLTLESEINYFNHIEEVNILLRKLGQEHTS